MKDTYKLKKFEKAGFIALKGMLDHRIAEANRTRDEVIEYLNEILKEAGKDINLKWLIAEDQSSLYVEDDPPVATKADDKSN